MSSINVKEPTEEELEAMTQEEVMKLAKKVGLKPKERHPEKDDLVKMLRLWFANRDYTPDPEWDSNVPDPDDIDEAKDSEAKKLEKEQREERKKEEKESELERWADQVEDYQVPWWTDRLRVGGLSPLGKGVDFVTYYKHYMDGLTDACEPFKEAAALFLISTLCRWNFAIWEHNNLSGVDSVETIPLNVWFAFIGKSRIARKSTIIKPLRKLLWKITEKREITRNYGKTKRSKTVNAVLPDMFTPEALISTLFDRCWDRRTAKGGYIGKKTHATWINDEVSGFFTKLHKQDYQAGTAEALSNLYDCPDYYFHETMKRGEESVQNPYLTLMIASTFTLPKLFTPFQLEQGFLNRMFYILDDQDREFERKQVTESGDRWNRIEGWLQALYDCKPERQIYLILLNKEFMKFDKRVFKYIAKEELGVLEGYFSQLPILVQKLAGLYCISRLGLEDFHQINLSAKNEYIPAEESTKLNVWNWRWISDEDYKRAYKFLMLLVKNFKSVVKLSSMKEYYQPVKVIDASAIMVYDGLKSHFDKTKEWATFTDIYQRIRRRVNKLDIHYALDSLCTTNNILIKEVRRGNHQVKVYKPIKAPKIEIF